MAELTFLAARRVKAMPASVPSYHNVYGKPEGFDRTYGAGRLTRVQCDWYGGPSRLYVVKVIPKVQPKAHGAWS